MPDNCRFIGWDIGGANLKGCRIEWHHGAAVDQKVVTRTFEMWNAYEALAETLREMGAALELDALTAMAVTMTAELADAFRSKREGVRFVQDALARAFPHVPIYYIDINANLVPPDAVTDPVDLAATNWLASVQYLASRRSDFIFMDVGSTTTDIIPVRNGRVAAVGYTDTDRLASGELVYTGVLRSNPNTLAQWIPVQGRPCRTAAEYFCNMGDVYLLLGHLTAEEYTCGTPDGRAKSTEAALERLARLVCADARQLDARQLTGMAGYLAERQVQVMTDALLQVRSVQPGGDQGPLLVAGSGSFLAAETGRRAGLDVIALHQEVGAATARAFPCLAVAMLMGIEREAMEK
jgi:(4-(4-[2-(gamma-L-glutamylamino)ethyl]phenoxymethyl)furan-2-yl)methanamine synthase